MSVPSIQQSILQEKHEIGSSVPIRLNASGSSYTTQADMDNGSQFGNPVCFQPIAQTQNACDFSQNDSRNVRFDNSEFAETANSSCSIDDSSFALYNESLMQLQNDAAAAAKAHATPHAKTSSSASVFAPVHCSLFQAKSSNSPLGNKVLFHESGSGGTFERDQTRGGDLRTCILNHSVPATPNLTETRNKAKAVGRPNCWVREDAKEEEDNSIDHIAAELDQNSSLTIDISCHSMSKTLQENHEPDMGSNKTVDIRTPHQKPRRRKHRPKVISADPLKPKRGTTKPTCSEKNNVAKRKYVRKNKGSTQGDTPTKGSSQGDTPTKGSTQGDTPTEGRSETDPVSDTIPRPKIKYTRRKGANETNSTATTEVVSGTTRPKSTKATRISCKRSLRFDSDNTIAGESSSSHQYVPDSNKSTSHISHGENQMTSEMKLGEVVGAETSLNNDLAPSRKKGFEDYIPIDEMENLCLSTPVKFNELHKKSIAGSLNESSRGKCHVIFSDTTHDKETMILDFRNQSDWVAKIPSCTSNNSNILSHERHARGMKRSADLLDKSRMNAPGQSNFVQNLLEVLQSNKYKEESPFPRCPEMYKKKRTNNLRASTPSHILPTVTAMECHVQSNATPRDKHCGEDFTVKHGSGMMKVHYSDDRYPTADNAHFEESKCEYIQSFRNSEQLTKSESKGCSEAVLASSPSWALLTNAYTNLLASQEVRESHGMHTCMGALVVDKDQRLTTKEWSKRNFSGSPPSMMSMRPVDAIVEQANCSDMAAQNQIPAILETNALIASHYEYPQQNALAVCKLDQTMIRFRGSRNRIKERRPRPKVNLDEETTRVWNLLLENINSDGIEGTDEEKRKWWEEERRVFRGRANSFIAKMRQVQGDRRFRPWKGSLVDSVIGVFLTQNVSDHLSSSAYMSMASRFPLKPNGGHQSCCIGGIDGKQDLLHSEQDCSGEDSVVLQVNKNNSNGINTPVFFRNSSEDAESVGNLKFPSSDSSECGPSMSTELKISAFDGLNDRTTVLDRDQRALGDILSSQNSVVSSQSSIDSVGQTAYEKELWSRNVLEEESISEYGRYTFLELLQMQDQRIYNLGDRKASALEETRTRSEETGCNLERGADHQDFAQLPHNNHRKEKERFGIEESGLSDESAAIAFRNTVHMSFEPQMRCNENHVSADYSSIFDDKQIDFASRTQKHASFSCEGIFDARGTIGIKDEVLNPGRKSVILDENNSINKGTASGEKAISAKSKSGGNLKEKQEEVDWDDLRKQAQAKGKREKQVDTSDSVDWEAVRCADVGEIAQTIKDRGMNNRLAERIKDFLNRLVREHGSIDLEWLRDVPPDKAKEYLLSIKGLGLKSVECVRLLTLHHLAFPVDTNVGRIAVRLGWVPLQPLPESLQLHLLELYPVLESIQKYLWPRLCKLDQKKLYELHYHMITFGKVFCTKNKPNCNACPMRGECRHFASAYASSRLTLPAPEDKSIVMATENGTACETQAEKSYHSQLTGPESTEHPGVPCLPIVSQPIIKVFTRRKPIIEEPETPEPEPIVEEPQTPESETESEPTQFIADIEDCYMENDNEIPTIDLNLEAFSLNVQNIIQNSVALQEKESSNSLVVLTPEAASIPMPKMKNINRLRTEHQVYLLPDSHQLLKALEKREEKDPCPYLLAIWAPGETINSIQPPERKCSLEASNQLCFDNACSSCNSRREANSQTVRGTLLIPSRTAMRGRFPLNGTYFQVNEVFADHETSLNPIDVPREWLWNLRRRTVYFGTSIPTIFRGLGPEDIMYCFWRGFVCVRGFDRATRAPRPLIARLHFPASRMQKNKGDTAESSLPKANV